MSHALDKNISPAVLIRFAAPTIASMIFMGVYTMVDGVFVSRFVGTDALSSINIIMPLISLSLAIGAMFGSGGSAIVACKMGQGLEAEARQSFSFISLVALLSSMLLSLVGFILLHPMLRFLGADAILMPYCIDYTLPTLIFMPVTSLAMVLQMFCITAGKAQLGFTFSILGGLTNIVLDYWLIVRLNFGVAGAAIATGIGYCVPCVLGLLYFTFNRRGALFFQKPKAQLIIISAACMNGASELVTAVATGVVTLLLNNILIRLAGSDGVASVTIILYAQYLLSSIYMGYAMGIAPLISYNYGKQDSARLKKIYKISLLSILFTSIATFAVSLCFARQLVLIFAQESSPVYTMALHGFQLFASCFLFMGFNIFSSAMFTALSNGRVSATLSFCRTLLFVVVLSLVMPYFIGIDGVWLAIPLAEFFGIGMTIYYFIKLKGVYQY